MRKIFVAVLFVFIGTASVHAQNYNWGVGIRGGAVATGISFKGFVGGASALEGIVSFVDGVNFYGLYERHVPLIGRGFLLYYGFGANAGSWKRHGDHKFTVGADAVLGLEYKIRNVPLTIGADYKPCLNFIGHTKFKWYDFGFTLRTAF